MKAIFAESMKMNNPHELIDARLVDAVDGGGRGRSDVLLDVGAVDEGEVDGARDVGGGQNDDVGVRLNGVELREKRVHDADGVRRLVARHGRLAR